MRVATAGRGVGQTDCVQAAAPGASTRSAVPRRRGLRVLLLALLTTGLANGPAAPAAHAADRAPRPTLDGASSGEHLWLVAPAATGAGAGPLGQTHPSGPRAAAGGSAATSGPWLLLHHHPRMAAQFRVAFTFETLPTALAAWGDRLWIVFPPSDRSDSAGEVWTLRALHNPALGTWFNEPVGRLELRPALPSRQRLEAFVADAGGPLALLRDHEDTCRLHRLESDRWTPTDGLPESLAQERGALRMVRSGSDGRTLFVIGAGTAPHAWMRVPRGGWTESRGPLGGEVAALAAVGETAVALLAEREGPPPASGEAPGDPGAMPLVALRAGAPLPLGRIAAPTAPWGLFGLSDGLRLATLEPEGALRLARIDLRSVETPEQLGPGGPPGERSQWVHVPLLGMVVVAGVMLALMFCSDRIARTMPLPEGVIPAELPRRALGVALDYAPAALVVWLTTSGPPLDLVTLPIWTAPLDRAAPAAAALALSCLAAGICEAIFGASLGKALCGLRVVGADGRRLGAGRCLLRALFKFFVLCLPVLGAFHLINAQRRGLPELVVDAAVVKA